MKRVLLILIVLTGLTPKTTFAQTMRPIPHNLDNSVVSLHSQKTMIQKPNTDTTLGKLVSNGYFSWRETGNSDIDAQNIQSASEKFKIEHPDIYNKISRDPPKVVTVSFDNFNSMSKEKQDYLLRNPDLFILDEKIKGSFK